MTHYKKYKFNDEQRDNAYSNLGTCLQCAFDYSEVFYKESNENQRSGVYFFDRESNWFDVGCT